MAGMNLAQLGAAAPDLTQQQAEPITDATPDATPDAATDATTDATTTVNSTDGSSGAESSYHSSVGGTMVGQCRLNRRNPCSNRLELSA